MTEAIITATIRSKENPHIFETFKAKVNDKNQLLARRRLEQTKQEIIDMLKQFKKEGIIKSVFIPHSKSHKIQEDLDLLVKNKTEINKSLKIIKEVFGK